MNIDRLKYNIKNNLNKVDFAEFGSGVSDIWIRKAESRLNVSFPPSYIWWMKNYSGGEINGEEVFSIYEIDFDEVVGGDIVYINELNRKNGFTNKDQLVIQENDQGEIYYFNLKERNNDGEYPVYSDVTDLKYAENFLEFISKKIDE